VSVLIAGRIPPPSGGVTIHVQRLLQVLEVKEIRHSFCSTSEPLLTLARKVLQYPVIHLHASNPYFRCGFALFCFVSRRKLMQTYHGDLGRFGPVKNFFDSLSVVLTHTPVVINDRSLQKAARLNRRTRRISVFISPAKSELLSDELKDRLNRWRNGYSRIFCTNATSADRDQSGREIYGGSVLVEVFRRQPDNGLIFADPTGHYQEILRGSAPNVPDNIYFIDTDHSFMEILKLSDCYIRATTTDGDSLSIREALSLRIPVIASDCVDRPQGCTIFETGNTDDLLKKMEEFQGNKPEQLNGLDEVDKIIELYRER